MKRQTRPFTVEIKQKRSYQNRGRSIWSDVDLSAAMAESTRELKEMELPNRRLVDSNVVALDAEHMHKPRAEHFMAGPLEAESVETAIEPAAKAETPQTKKKAPRSRKAKAGPKPPARKNGANTASQAEEAPGAAAPIGRKVHSEKERTQKLDQKSISGGATLKSAVKQAGISEQTYYHSKNAAAPSSDGDDLKDLVALEEENKRLKSLLAQGERGTEEEAGAAIKLQQPAESQIGAGASSSPTRHLRSAVAAPRGARRALGCRNTAPRFAEHSFYQSDAAHAEVFHLEVILEPMAGTLAPDA
ncbi:transposase [Mesorhizobium sp.]|uniref:transposase n=1 Tax=Mesorhizobium sp. TaxID=1871066 RepID=UPI00257E4FF0|nr:transposase [Mesorhizobium sp.]